MFKKLLCAISLLFARGIYAVESQQNPEDEIAAFDRMIDQLDKKKSADAMSKKFLENGKKCRGKGSSPFCIAVRNEYKVMNDIVKAQTEVRDFAHYAEVTREVFPKICEIRDYTAFCNEAYLNDESGVRRMDSLLELISKCKGMAEAIVTTADEKPHSFIASETIKQRKTNFMFFLDSVVIPDIEKTKAAYARAEK